MKKSLLLIYLVVALGNLQAKNYYVATDGSDANNGTAIETPFQTIHKAATVAVAGDIINIRAGVYREQVEPLNSGASGAEIIYQPYNNEKVTINGTDPILLWQLAEGYVYKATMDWDISTDRHSNQIFIDGKMAELARWPKNTGSLIMPTNANAESVAFVGGNVEITDNELVQPDGRWDGAEIWINLSRTNQNGSGWDGQGWTGRVISNKGNKIIVEGDVSGRINDEPWGMGQGLEYYMFNPQKSAIDATGGMANALSNNEWLKDDNTLYVKTPNGNSPAANINNVNLVEAKKRLYAFAFENKSHIVISHLNIFGCSINTDVQNYFNSTTLAGSSNISIDNLNAKYISHFTNLGNNWQMMWVQRSGLILSGSNILLKNSTILYSAGSGVSLMGKNNKVLNNNLLSLNYSSSECGALNTGLRYDPGWTLSVDHEIAYNTIDSTPQQAINMRALVNSNEKIPGLARLHHNVIKNFMLRTHDSGGFDTFGADNTNWVRIDHNMVYNSNLELTIGVYIDFGGFYIIDHNLFWNIDRPIQCNQNAEIGYRPLKIYNNTAIADDFNKKAILNGVDNWGPTFDVRNNIVSGDLDGFKYGSIVRKNLEIASSNELDALFVDVLNNNYELKAEAELAINKGEYVPYADSLTNAPDLGCYEFGTTPWKAGFGNSKAEFILTDTLSSLPINGTTKTYTLPIYAIPYGEFNGVINLSLSNMPAGVTANLSSNTINPFGSVNITINTNTQLVNDCSFTLTGTSGDLTYTKTYAFVVPPVLSKIEISQCVPEIKIGSFYRFKALAYDQKNTLLEPQPAIQWAVIGDGKIDKTGKYIPATINDSEAIMAYINSVADTCFVKVNNVVSIHENDEITFQISPNPVKNILHLTNNEKIHEVVFFNSNGNKIMQVSNPANNINLNNKLPAGLYFLKIYTIDGYTLTKKIIKE